MAMATTIMGTCTKSILLILRGRPEWSAFFYYMPRVEILVCFIYIMLLLCTRTLTFEWYDRDEI